MFDMWMLSVSIYLVNSILSDIYTQNFLKEKYSKKVVFIIWSVIYFIIQIMIFEILDIRFPVGEVAGILLNICILLFLQFLFFEKEIQKQFFVVFSFIAGKEIIKYIVSIFNTVLNGFYHKILDYFIVKEIINTLEKSQVWLTVLNLTITILCTSFYGLLFFLFLYLISKKFVKKDYLLQTYENVFLILPCITALCISITIKMMIISVENGMTTIIFDTVPETKFWIPVICILLLSTIIASVILFQKLVQYNEEMGKRAILENQVQQMQKEIVEIQNIYADIRGLRHDMRNHISNISLFVKNISNSESEELESYIGKMEQTVNQLDFSYQTGNPITDIIIHQKKQEAEKKQIEFYVDFAYPPNLRIDVYDIAIILNNALENAIEACYKVEGKKQIKLYSYVRGSLFFIEVENDFKEKIMIDEKNGLPISSKINKKLHGIGISNIQRCAKKYMGDIDIVISDIDGKNKFSITIMMNGKSKSM